MVIKFGRTVLKQLYRKSGWGNKVLIFRNFELILLQAAATQKSVHALVRQT